MKNPIFLLLLILVCIACKQEPKQDGYTINGNVIGLSDGWVKLVETNMIERSAVKVIDSTQLENGKFTFKGKVDHVDMVQLYVGEKSKGQFFLENSPIQIETNISEASPYGELKLNVTGSKNQDLYTKFDQKQDSISALSKYADLQKNMEAMDKARIAKDTAMVNRLRKESQEPTFIALRQQWGKELADNRYAYADKNPSSPVATYVLGYMWGEGRLPNDELKRIYNSFSGPAKETAFFKYYEKRYDEIFVKFGPGGKVPEFTLTTVNGDQLTLSDVKGDYILIDFWASWCVPCRASFPHLKELYKQYKAKGFEVVAIGTADQEDKWRQAIIEDQTPWLHVYDKNEDGQNMYGPVAVKYSVPHLPTTFLVDSEGTIVLRQPQKEDLDKKLAEVFD